MGFWWPSVQAISARKVAGKAFSAASNAGHARRVVRSLAGFTFALTTLAHTSSARAQAAACLSNNPAHWPAPSKPYFMLVVDTSASMSESIGGTNSCGYPNNRNGHLRCAIKNTVEAFKGEVNFGLATYAWKLDGTCGATCGNCTGSPATTACFPGCSATLPSSDDGRCGPKRSEATLGGTSIHYGGYVQIPLVQDNYWSLPLFPSNAQQIVNLVDNRCDNGEIGTSGNGPLGGALFNVHQYFSGTYRDPFAANYPNNSPLASPLGPATFGGHPAERLCRSVNVILITEGDETCDRMVNTTPIQDGCRSGQVSYPNGAGEALASHAADRLWTTGVKRDQQTFHIKTHVIGFGGKTTKAGLDNIASCGGTGTSHLAANETALTQALSDIVGPSIKQETCDNEDNNCNGCIDEGFARYCNVRDLNVCCSWKTVAQRTVCGANACACCNWSNHAERTTCLDTYRLSITQGNPSGDRSLLPCTTVAQSQDPTKWLCYDPGDVCDELDNNCNGVVDEGSIKCGSPPHCPQVEMCNGQDDDCDGNVDQGNVCVGQCALPTGSAEVCDGCDNDCDGITDNGMSVAIPCGISGPGVPVYCQGVMTCKPPQIVPPGTCAPNGGLTACSLPITPPAETCNGLDDDCNGAIDDIADEPCVPTDAPPNLVFGGDSHCKMGTTQCIGGATQCVGFVGPTAEVCDGVDNDCDGTVDEPNAGGPELCGEGTQCVQSASGYGCATPCDRANPSPCPAGRICEDVTDAIGHPMGTFCVEGCFPSCESGKICDTSQSPPSCVEDKCDPNPCPGGSPCDPVTGACDHDPCADVVCPEGQVCEDGTCAPDHGVLDGGSETPSDGGDASPGSDDGGSEAPFDGGDASPGSDDGGWEAPAEGGASAEGDDGDDMATSGGCGCEVGAGAASRLADGRWALASLVLALGVRRRRRASDVN